MTAPIDEGSMRCQERFSYAFQKCAIAVIENGTMYEEKTSSLQYCTGCDEIMLADSVHAKTSPNRSFLFQQRYIVLDEAFRPLLILTVTLEVLDKMLTRKIPEMGRGARFGSHPHSSYFNRSNKMLEYSTLHEVFTESKLLFPNGLHSSPHGEEILELIFRIIFDLRGQKWECISVYFHDQYWSSAAYI